MDLKLQLGIDPGKLKEVIKKFRQDAGMTQEELAFFLGGIAVKTITNWESGRTVPRTKTMVQKLREMGILRI